MQLVVHRGTNINCPENSICGIKEIRKITKDAIIEIDIVPTKDNKLVLFHDLSLTRLCGIDKLVFDFTFDELNKIQDSYEFIELEEILKLFT
ncbi:glycerophosphodiester phosphodiesterase, partial [Poseidonibacter sp.]|uniref:glycerophosphodiester phosphodiesterase n=1 Tax=Poseidonibacter sp. TaxID=2321188 RepID=UPI003C7171CD